MARNRILATCLAAALALSAAAPMPAAAAPDAEDYAKVILGLVALGVVTHALRENRENNDRERVSRRDRERLRERQRQIAACQFEVRTRDGWADVYGRRCLDRAGVRVDRLPRECAFRVRARGETSVVYGERCLEDYGYRFEARRRH